MAPVASYAHYGARHDLYGKVHWQPWIRALDRHWPAFLNGAVEWNSAYHALAEALTSSHE